MSIRSEGKRLARKGVPRSRIRVRLRRKARAEARAHQGENWLKRKIKLQAMQRP